MTYLLLSSISTQIVISHKKAYESLQNVACKMLLAIKVQKYLSKECWLFLIYAILDNNNQGEVYRLNIVRDFPDVPEDLLGLPP